MAFPTVGASWPPIQRPRSSPPDAMPAAICSARRDLPPPPRPYRELTQPMGSQSSMANRRGGATPISVHVLVSSGASGSRTAISCCLSEISALSRGIRSLMSSVVRSPGMSYTFLLQSSRVTSSGLVSPSP